MNNNETVAVSVATAGAGAVLMGVVLISSMASIATSAAIAVGTQYAISGNTEQIQSGGADSTTTTSRTTVGSSLLFNNINISTKQDSTTSLTTTHTNIEPDYNSLVKGAAITGLVVGGTEVAGAYISKVKADYLAQHPEAKWMEQGNSNFKSGTMENSKVGVNAEYNAQGVLVKEGANTPTNYWSSNKNPVFQATNLKPGMPSGSYFHDALNLATPWNELTIIPALTLSDFSACGALCAGAVTNSTTETQKDTTTNTVTIKN